jgi:4-alpha-glucanotransferase
MSDNGYPARIPPFPPEYRASGILLHIASLPSPYGIGDVGPSALAWVDRLHDAGQSWWHTLPVGPTGYGNSPYQSLSSFAGNGLLVSPGWLIQDGLLRPSDCERRTFPETTVDYGAVTAFKHGLLERSWTNFKAGQRKDLLGTYERFCDEQAHWVEDYALFRALKTKYKGACFLEWPSDIVRRVPRALEKARLEVWPSFDQVRFAQFLLFQQTARLKQHAHAKGVRLIGDLPFFVSPDSSDVWANSELFLLDEERHPRFVAGVPPDYPSEQGQLWGNPVYDWDALCRTGYRWCIARVRALLSHVDVIRLVHFRGFAAAWHVPAGAPAAQTGEWVPGPGADFFNAVQRKLGCLPFIAEDLGITTPDVCALRDQFHIPGTRVLQFAFDGDPDNPNLPNNLIPNTAVYTGTHDNDTTCGWFENLPAWQRRNLWSYLRESPSESDEPAWELIRLAWSSVAALAITPLPDLLNFGSGAHINGPGHAHNNWSSRFTEEMLPDHAFRWLRDLTRASHRSGIGKKQAVAFQAAS